MNPDLILIILPFAIGIIFGIPIGIIAVAKVTAHRLVRKEREAWAAAAKFHQLQARESR
jgi:ABC-type antimicrobial peptide transport system permease subunit